MAYGAEGQLLIYTVALGYKLRVNEKAKIEGEISKLKMKNSRLNSKLKTKRRNRKSNIHLEDTLIELKKTQNQLIHAGKMASWVNLLQV